MGSDLLRAADEKLSFVRFSENFVACLDARGVGSVYEFVAIMKNVQKNLVWKYQIVHTSFSPC